MQSAATSKMTNAKMKFAMGPATTIESRWSLALEIILDAHRDGGRGSGHAGHGTFEYGNSAGTGRWSGGARILERRTKLALLLRLGRVAVLALHRAIAADGQEIEPVVRSAPGRRPLQQRRPEADGEIVHAYAVQARE
jgi:hypothetical protein